MSNCMSSLQLFSVTVHTVKTWRFIWDILKCRIVTEKKHPWAFQCLGKTYIIKHTGMFFIKHTGLVFYISEEMVINTQFVFHKHTLRQIWHTWSASDTHGSVFHVFRFFTVCNRTSCKGNERKTISHVLNAFHVWNIHLHSVSIWSNNFNHQFPVIVVLR